jgi:DNA-binding response OmpR family regulator
LKRILLVEDNVMNSELIRDILEMENHEISCAADGIEALDHLAENIFDLVLTDINLPKMSGLELMKHIRNNMGHKVKVVALSSDTMTKDGKLFDEIGFDGYIQKPFKIGEFRRYIKPLLDD